MVSELLSDELDRIRQLVTTHSWLSTRRKAIALDAIEDAHHYIFHSECPDHARFHLQTARETWEIDCGCESTTE